ncbi:acylphosphatase [Secundilactobacillus folii]|nr:acylphosphatase [Secundilactobacillus folii]
MESVLISVSGRVQGVGFRWTTARLANRMGITGWIKNEADGSVTVRAEAEKADLTAFIKALRHSPTPYASIRDVQITSKSVEDFKKFVITD